VSDKVHLMRSWAESADGCGFTGTILRCGKRCPPLRLDSAVTEASAEVMVRSSGGYLKGICKTCQTNYRREGEAAMRAAESPSAKEAPCAGAPTT
jgi:hypothetical protein